MCHGCGCGQRVVVVVMVVVVMVVVVVVVVIVLWSSSLMRHRRHCRHHCLGLLALITVSDVAGVSCPFGAQRGRKGGWVAFTHLGCVTWALGVIFNGGGGVSTVGGCWGRQWVVAVGDCK